MSASVGKIWRSETVTRFQWSYTHEEVELLLRSIESYISLIHQALSYDQLELAQKTNCRVHDISNQLGMVRLMAETSTDEHKEEKLRYALRWLSPLS
ncbi:hypothetical protein BDZ91DRAFT_751219 [Kalaharituber pfeilii]|nr:hypothetical protein BDZ91DRAFT_751219 [Kalaharituber pfeilii]